MWIYKVYWVCPYTPFYYFRIKERFKMNTKSTLEFDIILEKLSELALSQNAKVKLLALTPSLSERECKQNIADTSDAKKILETIGNPPIAAMYELSEILELAQKGAMLTPLQLSAVATFLNTCKRLVSFLKKAESLENKVAFYGRALNPLSELYEQIDSSIVNEKVHDLASKTLQDIRRKIENKEISVKVKLETVLKSKKKFLSDSNATTRNGRFVLPVKKEYKNQVSGTVVDASATGFTVFIEPSSISKLQEELSYLQIEEDNEVRRVLYTLTALVDDSMQEIKTNVEYMELLDFIFAKAKFSESLKAIEVPVTTDRAIKIVKGRHPLLKSDICVPLDFEIGGDVNGVIITGPNTGGKTVAIKTVGLLSLMAQSGLHVPCEEGSVFSMHSSILCDIGDGQSISENLSTFSSHIKKIVEILSSVTHESLVLLDELGSGTDPAEGMGIAIAILDELRKRSCLFVATTHYPEIKSFAQSAPKLINARMGFDKENLKPLYKLQIGEAGESCALHIAKKLGLPEHLLNRARAEAYKKEPEIKREFVHEDSQEDYKKTRNKIVKNIEKKETNLRSKSFNMGDSVKVYPQKDIGIVYKTADDNGDLIIQIKGKKISVNHKRIKLLMPADKLYPPDYDFSIVFDTVENRKARHKMEKGHNPDLLIKHEDI